MEELEVLESYRKRALEDLRESQLLLESHLYVGAISRGYYACFHAIKYLLLSIGVITKSHRHTLIEFRKHFVKERRYSVEDSALAERLFQLRQNADYDAVFEINEDKFRALLQAGEMFVKRVCGIDKGVGQ